MKVVKLRVMSIAVIASFLVAATTAVTAEAGDRYSPRASSYSSGSGYDEAEVVDVRPLYETVRYSEPREVCYDERVRDDDGRYSATGPILGAVIGGAIGNAVGHKKRNKQVGTVVGAILGGAVGHDISSRNSGSGSSYRTEQVCDVEHEYREEERISGYNVTYRYAGETYTTRMSRDPGRTIRVRVQVSPVDDGYNGRSDLGYRS